MANHSTQNPQPFQPENAPLCPLLFVKSLVCASIEWTKGPVIGAESEALITFWNQSDEKMDPVEIKLQSHIWMPDMGHGSAPITIEALGVGQYKLSKIYFIMGGYWDLHLQIFADGALMDEALLGINL